MTKREFLVAVKNLEGCTDEMKAVADKMIAGLDKKASKPTKAQIENEAVKNDILAVLEDGEARTAREIAEAIGVTTNKAAALLRQIEGVEKIPGEKTKDAPKYRKAQSFKLSPSPMGEGLKKSS